MGTLAGLAAIFGLMGAAFGVACIAHPRKGARAAVVLALMVTCPVWVAWNRGLGQPHPQALQAAVDFADVRPPNTEGGTR